MTEGKNIIVKPMRMSLLALLTGLSLVSCENRPAADALARPSYQVADLPDDAADHIEGVLVVDFADGTTQAQIDEEEKAFGIDLTLNDQVEGVDSAIAVGAYSGDPAALIAKIKADPKVEVVEPLMRVHASGFTPNDPQFDKQWNLKMLNLPAAWERTRGKGVVVAVIDTGIAYEDHDDFRQVPDLQGARFVDGYDFVNDDEHANDDHGHGTHVAGTIAQVTNNNEGVAGVAFEASLMPIKVLDHFGSGNSADIADAIRWAVDHGAKVLNLSLGGGGRSDVMAHAVEYARAKGAVVVCAAGNAGRGVVEFPAAYPGAVAVGAVGPSGARAPYSSWGKELDIAAPGGDKSQGEAGAILQNTIDPQDVSRSVYAGYQGTSMATPHVAGVAALLFSYGAKTPDQVEKALFASARPATSIRGWNEQFGHGIVDAEAALKALRAGSSAETQVPGEVAEALTGIPGVTEPSHDVSALAEAPAYRPFDWRPFAWAVGMLAFVLLTLGRKERPGYLNVLASPGFFVPLVLSTLGVFFVRWLSGPSDMTASLVIPLPDWLNRIIFGRGSLANPLVYSALLPVVASLIAIKVKVIRPIVGGLAIGFAAILSYAAWAKAPPLAYLPLTYMAIPWLVGNALLCLFVARAMIRREQP